MEINYLNRTTSYSVATLTPLGGSFSAVHSMTIILYMGYDFVVTAYENS
jgi:hypothetical protein